MEFSPTFFQIFPAGSIWVQAANGPGVGVKRQRCLVGSMAQMAEMKHFEATLRNLGSSIQKTQSHVVDMLFSNICFIYFMIYVCFTYLLYICFTYKYYCSTFTDSLICSHICCFTSMLLHIYIYISFHTDASHVGFHLCLGLFWGI